MADENRADDNRADENRADNQREQRQRLRAGADLPAHFCNRCTALRASDEGHCPECGAGRPDAGWKPLADAFDPFLGRVLSDRYLISKIEGRGSSSTIYRAESHGARRFAISKRFAIKMVKLWHSEKGVTEQVRTRIEREVRAVGMLRNPHIVRVYEMLELDRDWLALVMDHIEGRTVEECIDADGPFDLERACALVRQVANGLCEAHDVGMIHRDIKPANIMIETLPDGHDFAYLLDFGVVRLEGEAGMTQGFLGTPLFASPEQATGGDLDRRSDIYSLGATLFYLLTGHAPFESDRTLEVLKAHVKKPAPRLADVCPDRWYPPALEELVARMLAKAPAERPDDLFEVIDAMHTVEKQARKPRPPSKQTPGDSADLTNLLSPEDSSPIQASPGQASPSQTGTQQSDQNLRRTLAGPQQAGGGSTMAFQDRPKTVLGVRHAPAVDDAPDPADITGDEGLDSAEIDRDQWRSGRDSAEVSAIRQTNPRGFPRPSTGAKRRPAPRNIPVRQTVQFIDDEDASAPSEPQSAPQSDQKADDSTGYAFARTVRLSGASSEDLIAFVDAQNEVWTVAEDGLEPVCNPLSRVCSLSATEAGAFVGLADGTINRVWPERGELEALFRDDVKRAVTSLSAARDGRILLAGTDDGALFLGRLQRQRDPWMALNASRPIASVALSPDGAIFAVASVDNFLRVASTDTPGNALAKIGLDAAVTDMAFSNDGHLLAILLDDGRLPVYQVHYGRKISELSPDCPRPQSLYFSRQNILYGVCTRDGRIGCWNLTTGRAAGRE